MGNNYELSERPHPYLEDVKKTAQSQIAGNPSRGHNPDMNPVSHYELDAKLETALESLASLLVPLLPFLKDADGVTAAWGTVTKIVDVDVALEAPVPEAPKKGKRKKASVVVEDDPSRILLPLVDRAMVTQLVVTMLAEGTFHEELWRALKAAFDPPREEE